MDGKPKVSVFIPAYNAVAYIEQAIQSVLAQSCRDYELIVVDDASTDGTAELIKPYQNYPAVRVYHNETNLGVAGNWNRGVELCRGDFIVRLDADDFLAPHHLEKLLAIFEQFPDTDMVFSGANLLYEDVTRIDLPYAKSWVQSGQEFLPELLRVCRIWSPAVCLRRSCYDRLGGVIGEMDIHEDWEMWVRVAANGRVAYVAEPLAYIRFRNARGCTDSAIEQARGPVACQIWLDRLAQGSLPYQLSPAQLALLKRGMYDLMMAFAVFAMEQGLTDSVQKHLDFARQLVPSKSGPKMEARLYARAAEMYFMEGGHHRKAWRYLLWSLRYDWGLPFRRRNLKLWARAFFGKTIFEFMRERTVARRRFPYTIKPDCQ